MTKRGMACPVAHHNHHSTACPVALVHTTTVIVQLINTGVCHNCHGIACPFALVHTTTLTVELFTMSLHDTNLSFSRNYFTWFEYPLQA